MPSTDRKLELTAKTSMAHTASQAAVYAKGLKVSPGKGGSCDSVVKTAEDKRLS
jgi:hypothetical protein